MFITIQELELRKLEFAESFAPGTIDLGPDVIQRGDFKTVGRAELLEENHGGKLKVQDIRLVGDFSTQVELKCARCLDPVVTDLAEDYDLLYRPLGTIKSAGEIEISAADGEIGFYQGEGLLLEDALKEQALLAMPLKALCKENCKGLCAHCGRNLNTDACACDQTIIDPRWNALAGIKEKLKH
jgi:uncharacterized protein